MRVTFQLLKHVVLALGVLSLGSQVQASDIKFGLPIKCKLEKDCFIQNLPDIIEGEGVADSFCHRATYNGHKGVDIRLFSLEDIKRNVPVIAAANGIIKATRDGEIDKLIATQEDRQSVKNKECGNGILIAHPNGFESQYCHMKQGSIVVKKGQQIKQGDTLGFVGSSGFSQFPHIHLSIRKNGQWIDPISGNPPAATCAVSNLQNSLLNQDTHQYFQANTTRLIASGISGTPIVHGNLVKIGVPEKLKEVDQAIIGWAWFINLRKNDEIRFTLEGPQGLIAQNTTNPIENHKATYSAFAGKKLQPEKGEYRLRTELLRDGQSIEDTLFVQILE